MNLYEMLMKDDDLTSLLKKKAPGPEAFGAVNKPASVRPRMLAASKAERQTVDLAALWILRLMTARYVWENKEEVLKDETALRGLLKVREVCHSRYRVYDDPAGEETGKILRFLEKQKTKYGNCSREIRDYVYGQKLQPEKIVRICLWFASLEAFLYGGVSLQEIVQYHRKDRTQQIREVLKIAKVYETKYLDTDRIEEESIVDFSPEAPGILLGHGPCVMIGDTYVMFSAKTCGSLEAEDTEKLYFHYLLFRMRDPLSKPEKTREFIVYLARYGILYRLDGSFLKISEYDLKSFREKLQKAGKNGGTSKGGELLRRCRNVSLDPEVFGASDAAQFLALASEGMRMPSGWAYADKTIRTWTGNELPKVIEEARLEYTVRIRLHIRSVPEIKKTERFIPPYPENTKTPIRSGMTDLIIHRHDLIRFLEVYPCEDMEVLAGVYFITVQTGNTEDSRQK